MLELDFPRDLSKYTKEKHAANEVVRMQYGVQNFTTVLLLDSDGLPFAELVGASKDVAEYLPRLAEAEAVLEKRNAAWSKVAGTEGLAQAKLLGDMLQTVPESLRRHYQKVIATIVANDPEDSLGYAKHVAKETLKFQQKASDTPSKPDGSSKAE